MSHFELVVIADKIFPISVFNFFDIEVLPRCQLNSVVIVEGRCTGLCLAGGEDCRRHECPDVLHGLSAVNLAIEWCGGEVMSDSFDFD